MSEPGKKPAAPTSDAIRAAIDAGKGSDKVAFPDPAAVPFGTDDEAGGHPPTPRTTPHGCGKRAPATGDTNDGGRQLAIRSGDHGRHHLRDGGGRGTDLNDDGLMSP